MICVCDGIEFFLLLKFIKKCRLNKKCFCLLNNCVYYEYFEWFYVWLLIEIFNYFLLINENEIFIELC